MKIDFSVLTNGLIPAIIQDSNTLQVLMLAYMNEEALQKTLTEKRVCFFSRSKKRLWTKGETSGNYLELVDIQKDCDADALLIRVNPAGPTCHLGTTSCFGDSTDQGFLYNLEKIISHRIESKTENSYTNQIYKKGINKIAQKVGEEAIELIIEAKDDNKDLFLNEAADLMYHFILLLRGKDCRLKDIERLLFERHNQKT